MLINGLEESTHVVVKAEQLIRMLKSGRVDFILMNEKRLVKELEANNLARSEFEKVFSGFRAIDYMAFNRETSLDLVRKLRKAYWELLIEGKIVLH